MTTKTFYGNNLDVLGEQIALESVDLEMICRSGIR
jgi:hypothetical protein